MVNKCSPKCVFFPIHSYEKNIKNYEVDNYGVKKSSTQAICAFDDHIIKDWKPCVNFRSNFKDNDDIIPIKEKMIVIVGKSGSGKDYVSNYLANTFGFNKTVSYTTRPKRDGEVEGKDYYYLTTEEFCKKNNNDEFIETREYTTKFNDKDQVYFYGTSKEEIDNKTKKICIVDLKGLKEIKKYYGEENLLVIFIDAADEIRQRRAMRRGSFDKSEWYRRLKDDNKKFKDFEYDYKIMNNKTQTELEYKVCDILRKEDLI